MSSETEIIVDVSELPPPKPMEIVLDALDEIKPGQYIRMIHRMEPHPLYNILMDNGYRYKVDVSTGLIHIFIWKSVDKTAENLVKSCIND